MNNQAQRRAKKERKRKDRQLLEKRLAAQADLINCAVCGKGRKRKPNSKSGWRTIEWQNKQHYICPDHFPSGGTATAAAVLNTYNKIFAKIAREEL